MNEGFEQIDVECEIIVNTIENIERKISQLKDSLSDEQVMEVIFDEICENVQGYRWSEIHRLATTIFTKLRCKEGILHYLLEDDEVNEVMVNGPDKIFYEKHGKIHKFSGQFNSIEELEEVIRKFAEDVHREINERSPLVDARLEDGSRINGVFKNIAINGPILTIRKFGSRGLCVSELVAKGTMTDECAYFLKDIVGKGYNIFVSGGTSSGKTTLLNALSEYIPKGERVIVIEDSAELSLRNVENLVQLECRHDNTMGQGEITIRDLIKASLRMRPDRIIVGEVRGGEVAEMLQAFNTGHDGSLSTGHGNSIKGMLRRLEAMYLMGTDIPMDAIRAQICEGIDIMVHLMKDRDGNRKVVEIGELLGYKDGEYEINWLFKLDESGYLKKIGGGLVGIKRL